MNSAILSVPILLNPCKNHSWDEILRIYCNSPGDFYISENITIYISVEEMKAVFDGYPYILKNMPGSKFNLFGTITKADKKSLKFKGNNFSVFLNFSRTTLIFSADEVRSLLKDKYCPGSKHKKNKSTYYDPKLKMKGSFSDKSIISILLVMLLIFSGTTFYSYYLGMKVLEFFYSRNQCLGLFLLEFIR